MNNYGNFKVNAGDVRVENMFEEGYINYFLKGL